jgi:rhamnulokinase
VRTLAALAGREVGVVHIVGGGSRNRLLFQLTADACGVLVVAGPAEAAALGNALVAARAIGGFDGGLAELRALVAATQPLTTYQPRPDEPAWDTAQARLVDHERASSIRRAQPARRSARRSSIGAGSPSASA